jgi:pimeloyl-ACP methyl ester carboxylesterase
MTYEYDASRAALFSPARNAGFFRRGRPHSEPALCAELSRLAYAPYEESQAAKQKVEGILRQVGFSPTYCFDARGTQGFLTSDLERGLTVLAFRGTQVNPRDWFTDLQAWPKTWPEGGEVHIGFAAALEAVWGDLAPRLAAPGRLIYTGHSLGAALATLAASRRRPHVLYTYGSPRVGNRVFLDTLSGLESRRFTNCCDMVCRIPFELFGYRHLGPALYLNRDGIVSVGPSIPEMSSDHLRARIAYWSRWRRGDLWTRDLADHSPVNYFSALEAGGGA